MTINSKSNTITLENVIHLTNGKPKRPLSGYNIFYRLARCHLMEVLSQGKSKVMETAFEEISSMGKDILMERCLHIIRDYRFNKKNIKTKNLKSMKTIGSMIKFQDLTRVIAKQWAKLSPSTRSVFESCSKEDKQIYIQKRNQWRQLKDAKIKLELEKQLIQDDNNFHSHENLQQECQISTGIDDSSRCLSPVSSSLDSREMSEANQLYNLLPSIILNANCSSQSNPLKGRHALNEHSASTISIVEDFSETDYSQESIDLSQKLFRSGSVMTSQYPATCVEHKWPFSFFQLGQRYGKYHMKNSSCDLDFNDTGADFHKLRQGLLMDVFDDDAIELNQFFSCFCQ